MLRTAGLLAFLSEDIVSGLRRPDFAGFVSSSPLSYSAAGTLPRPDFHRQAQRGFSLDTPNSNSNRRGSRTSSRAMGTSPWRSLVGPQQPDYSPNAVNHEDANDQPRVDVPHERPVLRP